MKRAAFLRGRKKDQGRDQNKVLALFAFEKVSWRGQPAAQAYHRRPWDRDLAVTPAGENPDWESGCGCTAPGKETCCSRAGVSGDRPGQKIHLGRCGPTKKGLIVCNIPEIST